MNAAIRLLPVFGALVMSLPALSGEPPRVPASAPSGVPPMTVIPRPAQVEPSTGRPFALTAEVRVRAVGEVTNELVERAVEAVRAFTGVTLKPGEGAAGLGEVVLRLDPSVGRGRPEWQAKESYRLAVRPDGSGVEIAAADPHGLFNGIQTLAQLARPGEDPPGHVPALKIEDWPRFAWRGVMLDCSRTFQSVEYLKKTLDRMAFYKLNVLHLHLTDDQGWRLEIKKRPELTRKGARFPDKYKEPETTQGFYSQEQMREIIAYAAQRYVTIVPEIEMPGHGLAALSCYPQLSCTGGPFEIFPFFKGPGITADVFCAGNDETFRFFEDVLGEVAELFPSPYVHLGGDEVPKDRWKKCPRCQERIRAEGLKNEEQLQSYFMCRAVKFLAAKGRRAIGWDEILEGGLPADAAVMSWRGMAGGTAAARADHDVVMSPTSHCYFDYNYGAINSQRAYSFEPLPQALSPEQARHVLGLQANFWSHIDRTPERVDYQLFPRLLALAERAWSPAECRDWEDFRARLAAHKARLRALGVALNELDGETPAGQWQPKEMAEDWKELAWDVSAAVKQAGSYEAAFWYARGKHRLGIERVALWEDGKELSFDAHYGVTGAQHKDNLYVLKAPQPKPQARYELRARVRSEGGTDSYGDVYLRRLERPK